MVQFSISPALNGTKEANFLLKESLGSGGIASVYRERIGQQDYAIKIYTDPSAFEAAKIDFMIANPPAEAVREFAGVKYPRYAWPLAVTKAKEPSANSSVGYAMPVIDAAKSKTLDYFFDHNLSKQLKSAESKALSFKIEILKNLSESIEELHKAGHIFVDLKPQNVRVFEGTNIVTFLDCDGFTIGEPGGAKRFQSTMVSPDYVAPEITRRTNRNAPIGVEQDEYALAVMIFQMLNNGIHPFQGIIKDPNFNAPTNDDKAALGLYPHGITPNPRIIPRPQSLHDTWLDETRFLLDRAFVEGNTRPTSTEWKQHFDKILTQKLLARCSNRPGEVEHIRFRDKSCPACLVLQYRGTQPRPKPVKPRPTTGQYSAPKAAPAHTAPAGPSNRPRKFLLHFVLTLLAGVTIIYGILWEGGDLERWAQTAPKILRSDNATPSTSPSSKLSNIASYGSFAPTPAAQAPEANPFGNAPSSAIADKIAAARNAGYSDVEIANYLKQSPAWGPKFSAAIKAGYSEADIFRYWGLKVNGQAAPQGAADQDWMSDESSVALAPPRIVAPVIPPEFRGLHE